MSLLLKTTETVARRMSTGCGEFKLKWNVRGKFPRDLVGACAAVSMGDRAYIAAYDVVYEYHNSTGVCFKLPSFGIIGYALAIVRGAITTIGGYVQGSRAFPDCLSWDKATKKWVSRYPAMQKAPIDPTVATTANHVVVAGGIATTAVSVMDVRTRKWSTVASLPPSSYRTFAAAVYNSVVYVAAKHHNDDSSGNCHLYYCPLEVLLTSAPKQKVWHKIEGPPHCSKVFNLITLNGRLLCIGLSMLQSPVIAVFIYVEADSTFLAMGELPISFPTRFQFAFFCATTLLEEKVLVIAETTGSNTILIGEVMSGKEYACRHNNIVFSL